MRVGFEEAQSGFSSASQIARMDSELWASTWMYCPNCGNPKLSKFEANRPVADFYCTGCGDQFELKSQSKKFGRKLINGAFSAKMERLKSDTSPNLMLLQYNRHKRYVENMYVVPKRFFVQSIVERRPPLAPTARRAGWVGSNIWLDRIPSLGRITIIENGAIRSRKDVLEQWSRTRFVSERSGSSRGWLVDVMLCVDLLEKSEFTLADVYSFEDRLELLYPGNSNIRPKIRQQLQLMRDNGYLEFIGNGHYRLK